MNNISSLAPLMQRFFAAKECSEKGNLVVELPHILANLVNKDIAGVSLR